MQSFGVSLNAWREIFARTFEGFQQQVNVSPEWLINPATNRRLKLDLYYPEIGFAVRFVGLTAKGQGRQSDWELLEEEQRDQTRAEICRRQQVQLFLVEPLEEPIKLIDLLSRLLLRAARNASRTDLSEKERSRLLQRMDKARACVDDLRSRINRAPEQMMTNLASSWRDREAGLLDALPEPAPQKSRSAQPPAQPIDFVEGGRIIHERFGEGVITACVAEENDLRITILFDGDQERTFLASIVQDKLRMPA